MRAMRAGRLLLVLCVMLAALLLSACSSDSDSGAAGSSAPSATTPACSGTVFAGVLGKDSRVVHSTCAEGWAYVDYVIVRPGSGSTVTSENMLSEGQAILKATSDTWKVVTSGGGAMRMADIVKSGVPSSVAKQLYESLMARTPTPSA